MPKTQTIYAIPCPICHTLMTAKPRRTATGWHDMFVCCERVWDVCCQREFEHIDWHALPVAQATAQAVAI